MTPQTSKKWKMENMLEIKWQKHPGMYFPMHQGKKRKHHFYSVTDRLSFYNTEFDEVVGLAEAEPNYGVLNE